MSIFYLFFTICNPNYLNKTILIYLIKILILSLNYLYILYFNNKRLLNNKLPIILINFRLIEKTYPEYFKFIKKIINPKY